MKTDDFGQITERVRVAADQVTVTPRDDIASVVRARTEGSRKRRIVGSVAASATVIGVVVALTVSLWPSSRAHNVMVTGPGGLSGEAAGAGVTPAGWVRVDYANASIAVPAGWDILWGDRAISPEPNNAVFLGKTPFFPPSTGGPVVPSGSQPPPTSFAGLSTLSGNPPTGTPVETNGHAGVRIADANPTVSAVFAYPDLGVMLVVAGPEANRIASTIGWSTSYLASHPASNVSVPSGWKSIDYDGVNFKVPPTWPVQDLTRGSFINPGQCGGNEFARPQVYEGSSSAAAGCPAVMSTASQGVDGVWVRPYPLPGGQFPPAGSISGPVNDKLFVFLPDSAFDDLQPVLHVLVGLPSTSPDYLSHSAVVIDIGIGPDPAVAQGILASLSLNPYLPIVQRPPLPTVAPGHPVEIPPVVGEALQTAEAALFTVGLYPVIESTPSTVTPKGDVIAITPPQGSQTMSGSSVTLEVSSGPLTR